MRRARVRCWFGAAAGYAVLLAAAWGAALIWLSPSEAQLDEQFAALDEQIKDDAALTKTTQQRVVEARANLEATQVIAGRPDWSLLLALLASHVGDEVVLTEFTVQPVGVPGEAARGDAPASQATGSGEEQRQEARFVMRLSGRGRSQAAVSQFVLRLEQLQLFDVVTLVDTRREPFGADSAVGFRIVCTMHTGEDAP